MSENQNEPDFANIASDALELAEHLHARHILKEHIKDLQAVWKNEDREQPADSTPQPKQP